MCIFVISIIVNANFVRRTNKDYQAINRIKINCSEKFCLSLGKSASQFNTILSRHPYSRLREVLPPGFVHPTDLGRCSIYQVRCHRSLFHSDSTLLRSL